MFKKFRNFIDFKNKVFQCFYFVNMLGLLQQQVVEQKVLCMYSVYKFKVWNLDTFILKFRINVSKVKVFQCFYFVNMLGLLQQQVVEQKVLFMYSVYKFKI